MDAADVRDLVSDEVKSVVADSQQQLLNNLDTMMNSRFNAFHEELQKSQVDVSNTQLAKLESTIADNFTFKRKGNENQFKHEAKVLSKLKEVNAHLNEPTFGHDSMNSAKQKLSEGIELVESRQKLIKLADSSQLGWKVVQEYSSNPIADDSEDEKKMYRAQMRAERKAKEERFQKRRSRGPYPSRSDFKGKDDDDRPTRRPGRCFDCGAKGHWSKDCKKEKENKISFDFDIFNNCKFCKVLNKTKGRSCQKRHSNAHECTDGCAHCYLHTCTGEQYSALAPDKTGFEKKSSIPVSPVGRLRTCYDEWSKIGSNDHVLSVVKEGYKIPFKTEPNSAILKNNRSARDNGDFVSEEIDKLLSLGCVSKVSNVPKVVNPLTVAFNKKGKKRLVLDCRHINPHLFKFKFRYEDGQVAREMFKKDEFLFTFDLKSAYHHIEINEKHREFLGFSWNSDYYIFNVLPFGLSTAGHIFTKLLREPVRVLRSQGIKVITYLDDGIAGGSSYEHSKNVSVEVKKLLVSLGFIFAEDKCNWDPAQCVHWLGYSWDLNAGIVRVSQDRVESIMKNLQFIIGRVQNDSLLFEARFLAKLVGRIISTQAVFGTSTRFYTRYLYQCILDRASWNAKVKISPQAINEVHFWAKNCKSLNDRGCSLSLVDASDVCNFTIFCDASDVGYGGYILPNDGNEANSACFEVSGSWSNSESELSSTWRELESINRVLKSSSSICSQSNVKVVTDNKNVPTILSVGSKKSYLQDLSVNVSSFCEKQNISLNAQWVPRSENKRADTLSRVIDLDDWSIGQKVFDMLDSKWGKHTIDRFASHYNNKCIRFNSKVWCPGCEAIDAFKQNWSNEMNWLVPPPSDISLVINKMKVDSAKGTLVVPEWKSAPFWPLISNGFTFKHFVKEWRYLNKDALVIEKGKKRKLLFTKYDPLKFNMIALRISF